MVALAPESLSLGEQGGQDALLPPALPVEVEELEPGLSLEAPLEAEADLQPQVEASLQPQGVAPEEVDPVLAVCCEDTSRLAQSGCLIDIRDFEVAVEML